MRVKSGLEQASRAVDLYRCITCQYRIGNRLSMTITAAGAVQQGGGREQPAANIGISQKNARSATWRPQHHSLGTQAQMSQGTGTSLSLISRSRSVWACAMATLADQRHQSCQTRPRLATAVLNSHRLARCDLVPLDTKNPRCHRDQRLKWWDPPLVSRNLCL